MNLSVTETGILGNVIWKIMKILIMYLKDTIFAMIYASAKEKILLNKIRHQECRNFFSYVTIRQLSQRLSTNSLFNAFIKGYNLKDTSVIQQNKPQSDVINTCCTIHT